MDEVDFVVRAEHHPPVGHWLILDIRVNGARLQEMVQHAVQAGTTRQSTAVPAGPYMGLDPAAATTGHFLGQPVVMSIEGRPKLDRALLRCTCGEPGCDSVIAEVRVEEYRVTWQGFRAAGAWLDIGPFEFDREQYNEALASATRSPHAFGGLT